MANCCTVKSMAFGSGKGVATRSDVRNNLKVPEEWDDLKGAVRMIKIDGLQPDLNGTKCEELFCQQYLHKGQLEDEADVVLLKIADEWHQLYFDAGVVHWRVQDERPEPRRVDDDAVFSYPMVDLGSKFGVRGQMISACQVIETKDGETVSLLFEEGAKIQFVNHGDSTIILYEH